MSTLTTLKSFLEEVIRYEDDDGIDYNKDTYPKIDVVSQELAELDCDHERFIAEMKNLIKDFKEDECKNLCETRIAKLKADEHVIENDLITTCLNKQMELEEDVKHFPIPSYENLLMIYLKGNEEFKSLKKELSATCVTLVELEEKSHKLSLQTANTEKMLKFAKYLAEDQKYQSTKSMRRTTTADSEMEEESAIMSLQNRLDSFMLTNI
jgi:hypothetical protein